MVLVLLVVPGKLGMKLSPGCVLTLQCLPGVGFAFVLVVYLPAVSFHLGFHGSRGSLDPCRWLGNGG